MRQLDGIEQREVVKMGIDLIVDYLRYLGVDVSGYNQEFGYQTINSLGSMHPSMHLATNITTTIDCTCDGELYKYMSKYSVLTHIKKVPVINRDAMFGEKDIYFFQFMVRASNIAQLESFTQAFKKDTEALRYKIFNAEMDKQITEELSQPEK